MYQITKKQYDIADKIGVIIMPSKKKYKIDIYDGNGVYVFSVGDAKFNDYFSHLSKGKDYANDRKRLYFLRHRKDAEKIGSRGWFAWKILWNGD